ncbi:hypothetical protein [Phocaeicola vulgatus]|uniref:hypothetical protein n=1 Tax=Phocaeicola vulgatus TaxID=821 RepID=UPI0032EAB847
MQTTTSIKAGNAPDLLSGILSVQVRNEEKITEQDRLYCQSQQDLLYKTLNQIEKWYAIFKEDAEQYRKERQFKYEDNGKVSIRDFYFHNGQDDYSHNEFKPFNLINDLVDKSHNANANFANRIISYFNKTYNVDVPVPKIDGQTLPMGFRPVYQTYVDSVIEHLGGKSFQETAEEELLARFLKTVRPSRWSKVKPELKKDKITFPDIVYWDSIHLEYHGEYEFSYDCRNKVNIFCEGIAYGSDDLINGSTGMVIGLDERNVDITQWYSLTTDNARQIKFYKNGRIDIRFKDSPAAENCYRRLHLDEITLNED